MCDGYYPFEDADEGWCYFNHAVILTCVFDGFIFPFDSSESSDGYCKNYKMTSEDTEKLTMYINDEVFLTTRSDGEYALDPIPDEAFVFQCEWVLK